ncbi:MAG: GGDEF domain-containing protein [Candidatus Limnocylindrales bacterium]
MAVVLLVLMAVMLAAALMGRGPLYGRFLEIERKPPKSRVEVRGGVTAQGQLPAQPAIRLLVREPRVGVRADAQARRGLRAADDELDEVLRGSFAVDTYNRAVRILAWSFILITLLIVSVSQVWLSVEPQIFATLILAGIFVLAVHEVIPPGRLRTIRALVEGTAAVVFLTMLVELTGKASSPFFFLYPLLVAGSALVASPAMTVLLTIETVGAFGIAALSGPIDAASLQDTLTRLAINLTALVLISYASLVIARVQRQTRDAAVRLSTVDSLTDLYNRAFFFNAVDREIQRGRRFRRGFCLLMMDLDGLKSINDRYGHYQGDVILRGVAQLIRAGLRSIDVAARYGGDEFVALLPETDPTGAYVVAEKIRQMVSELLVEAGGQQITTSLSIGVVSYPDDGKTGDELMIAADEAMYSSKRLGKNRVVGYAEPGQLAQSQAPYYHQPVATPGFRPIPRDADDRADSERP